jgi:hypothetical protein
VRPGFWPFVDLHAALAHVSSGRHHRMRALVEAIEQAGNGSSFAALRVRHVTLPGVRALDAWATGRYGDTARLLARLHPILPAAGGSTVQLEVFRQIAREARRRAAAQRHGAGPAEVENGLTKHPSDATEFSVILAA